MLCPEVLNFEAPCSLFQIQKVDGGLREKNIDNFYFNHLLSVILPDSLVCPESLTEKLISDCEYYKVFNLSLSEIIDLKFLCSFVKRGKLTLLSVDTRIDCDNCIGIIPNGELILNTDKDTYQSLGLEGKPSHFSKKTKNRYIVKVNLKEENLLPGNPNYIKIKSRLQLLGKFNVILLWEPPEDNICPSSVAKYFFDLGYEVKSCAPKFNSKTSYSIKAPDIDLVNVDEGDTISFIEWLGMISVSGDLEEEEKYVSSYNTPLPNKELGQVKHLQWRGFFSIIKIKEFIKELREYNKLVSKPWVALYVQGYSDSPVAWGVEEHHYFTNGDNGYLLIFNEESCLYCAQKCSKKRYK